MTNRTTAVLTCELLIPPAAVVIRDHMVIGCLCPDNRLHTVHSESEMRRHGRGWLVVVTLVLYGSVKRIRVFLMYPGTVLQILVSSTEHLARATVGTNRTPVRRRGC